jgi:hypothetical protein
MSDGFARIQVAVRPGSEEPRDLGGDQIMAMPDYQSLMLPVLEIGARGESSVPLAADEIAERFGLTYEEREQMLPS